MAIRRSGRIRPPCWMARRTPDAAVRASSALRGAPENPAAAIIAHMSTFRASSAARGGRGKAGGARVFDRRVARGVAANM